MGRIRRVRHGGVGIRRRGSGRGFTYVRMDGQSLKDREELERIRALAIPPAWTDVWICPDPDGHLQAVGTDTAERRQYSVSPRWRANRDTKRFARIEGFAEKLPQVRQVYRADINEPAVARNSYIDPRVFDRFEEGETILPAIRDMDESTLDDPSTGTEIEASVLALLRGDRATRSIAA